MALAIFAPLRGGKLRTRMAAARGALPRALPGFTRRPAFGLAPMWRYRV
jgi:hypothetical protein